MPAKPDPLTRAPALSNNRLNKTPGGLRSSGLLGKHPMVGLTMVFLGIALFGVMAINLQSTGPLIQTDIQVATDIHTGALQSLPFSRDVMIFGFYLGEQGIIALGVLMGLYFLLKRLWAELSMIVIAWAGEGSIWLALSAHFNRPRPVFDVAIWHQMTTPGFPSGHAFSAVMCFGLIAYLLVPKIRSHFGKTLLIISTLVIVVYIGYSRLFIGDHYLTDVLAGYGLGIAWTGFVYTSVELVASRRENDREFGNSRPTSNTNGWSA
jgi:undecaprenyl-diphosphatase